MVKLHPSNDRRPRSPARPRSVLRRAAAAVVVAVTMAAVVAASGCGERVPFPGAVKVTGIARFEGAPLARGTVQFGAVEGHDGGTARIGPDGRFAAWLKPGEYRAAVIAYDGIERVDDKGIPLPQNAVVPERYFSTERSGLTASIDKDRHTLEFDLHK